MQAIAATEPGADGADERAAARTRRPARALAPGGRCARYRQRQTGRRRRWRRSRSPTRLNDEIRTNTRALLALHGLGGTAERDIRERVAAGYDLRLRLDETQAAMWGGAVTGALVGLEADVLSGGLTLGFSDAGGVLGALGSAGLARCVNLVRGTGRSFVTWNSAALDTMVEAALLRLLGAARFRPRPRRLGAGRGAATLGRRRRRRARAAARGARRRLVGAHRQAAGRRCHYSRRGWRRSSAKRRARRCSISIRTPARVWL